MWFVLEIQNPLGNFFTLAYILQNMIGHIIRFIKFTYFNKIIYMHLKITVQYRNAQK